MATLYWGGGSGTWDASSTTHWYTDIGRTILASAAPTSADDVVFDSSSGAAPTVTISVAVCRNMTATAPTSGTLTFAMGTSTLGVYGSWSNPATLFAFSGTGTINFLSTSVGNTVTTNSVSVVSAMNFNGVGGGWTLGSNLTGVFVISVSNGTFDTSSSGNYSINCNSFNVGSGTKTVNFNASTITINAGAGFSITTATGTTFNAGTSQINLAPVNGSIVTGGFTFYNVSYTNAGHTTTGHIFSGGGTVNNLTVTSRAAAGITYLFIASSITINGTLTLSTPGTGVSRVLITSGSVGSTVGNQITLTTNAVSASLTDIDFRDIKIAGNAISGGNITGTRLGNCGNNSGITFTGARTVYWNSAASANWNGAVWSTSSGSTGGTALAIPLAQDSIIIDDAGLTAGNVITINANYNIPSLSFSTRVNAVTLAVGTTNPQLYGNLTFSSAVTQTGAGVSYFVGQNITQALTSANKTFTSAPYIASLTGTVQLQDNLTVASTATTYLVSGTLDLNNKILSTGLFNSSFNTTRSILFGTGNITITGSGTVWNSGTITNFSRTGTPTVNISNNSATATTVTTGAMSEAQSLDFNYTVGTYTLTDTSAVYKSLNFTGFTGTILNSVRTIYGNATYVAGMTLTAGANTTTFAGTSGPYTITTAKTWDYPITFNGIGGTWAFQDALTQGSTRAFTITNGTVQLKASATTTVGAFATSGTNKKYLQSTIAGTQATLTQATGTVNASYLTIKDINAIGGATWLAYTDQSNIDAGNVDGWNFGISPVVGGAEYTYSLRSFTQPRRF